MRTRHAGMPQRDQRLTTIGERSSTPFWKHCHNGQARPASYVRSMRHWWYGGRDDGLRSQTCDWEQGITRLRVMGAPGTRTRQTDFPSGG